MSYKYASVDIETTGLSRYKHKITWIGVHLFKDIDAPWKNSKKVYIYDADVPEELDKFRNLMKKCRERGVKLVFQNGKFDTLFIEHHLDLKLPIHYDIMVMGTAYDLVAPHGLKDMAYNYLGVPNWDIAKKDKTSKDRDKVVPYLTKDVRYTSEIFGFFFRNMTQSQWKVYRKLLIPAYRMYRDVERNGVYLNRKALKKVKKTYKEQAEMKLSVLNKKYKINWNSPQQVQDVLYQKEKIPVIKVSRTSGNPSADAKVLKRLTAKGYELPAQLLEYKFYYGANTKFLNRWGADSEYDGRIHPHFGITNVRTGRTSCSEPNLQQVPRNPELRSLYTAPEGRIFIEADYSQIELRIAADYANDKTMIKIYREGGDIHTETARTVSGKSEPTKEDRSSAKAVNFGFIYGMLEKGFIDYAYDNYQVIFTLEQATRYRQLFFQKFNRLLEWHDEMEALCEANGGVYNRFGRFRGLPEIYSPNKWERLSARRKAINTPVQSTASDLLIGAATQLNRDFKNENIKVYGSMICGTVHDSILVEADEDCRKDVTEHIKKVMAHPEVMDIFGIEFKVPIVADVGVGAWGSK